MLAPLVVVCCSGRKLKITHTFTCAHTHTHTSEDANDVCLLIICLATSILHRALFHPDFPLSPFNIHCVAAPLFPHTYLTVTFTLSCCASGLSRIERRCIIIILAAGHCIPRRNHSLSWVHN